MDQNPKPMLMPWMRLNIMNISILLILPLKLESHWRTAFQTDWQSMGGAIPIIRQRSLQAQKNSWPSSCPLKFWSYLWYTTSMLFLRIWSWQLGFHPLLQSTKTQPFMLWQLEQYWPQRLKLPPPPPIPIPIPIPPIPPIPTPTPIPPALRLMKPAMFQTVTSLWLSETSLLTPAVASLLAPTVIVESSLSPHNILTIYPQNLR